MTPSLETLVVAAYVFADSLPNPRSGPTRIDGKVDGRCLCERPGEDWDARGFRAAFSRIGFDWAMSCQIGASIQGLTKRSTVWIFALRLIVPTPRSFARCPCVE